MKQMGIMVAAPFSGSGKTAVSCALMAAFQNRGYRVRACKCGPDYIDPMYHREVVGAESYNLDLFFSTKEQLREKYAVFSAKADLTVIEGVMGYYDGITYDSDRASAYDVARTLEVPVLLVLPCRGAALSLAALVKGMAEFRPDSRIRGILLNEMSDMLYPKAKAMLEREMQRQGLSIPVVGYLPKDEAFHMESRHLGLVTPTEVEGHRERLCRAGEILSRTVDLEKIIQIAEQESEREDHTAQSGDSAIYGNAAAIRDTEAHGSDLPFGDSGALQRIRLGVARDRAFCFYYRDNLELLASLGCELVYFSPLSDPTLPEGLDGLLLGGGYPELFAKLLSENTSMLASVGQAVRDGMPCIAECGGFLYLHRELVDQEGAVYPMAGVIEGRAYPTGRLGRFGYVSVEGMNPGAFLKQGEQIRGHEFHYWDSTENGTDCLAVKPDGKRRWECVHMRGNLFAGFPHLYLPSLPAFAERFVEKCREYRSS